MRDVHEKSSNKLYAYGGLYDQFKTNEIFDKQNIISQSAVSLLKYYCQNAE